MFKKAELLRLVFAGVTGGLCVSLLGATRNEDTVYAKQFALRSEDGEIPGVFCVVGDTGCPSLSLMDKKKVERLSLRVLPDNTPSMSLTDSKGRARIYGTVTRTDRPALAFLSPEGETRMTFSSSPLGGTGLLLFDDKGRVRASLTMSDDRSESTLEMLDQKGQAILKIGVGRDGKQRLTMENMEKKSLISVVNDADKACEVTVVDGGKKEVIRAPR